MGFYKPDVYYQPEAFGLEKIAEIDFGLCGFDIFAAWIDKKTGRVYKARDSGCSCPSPFEDYTQGTDDLEEVTNIASLRSELMGILASNTTSSSTEEVDQFVDVVRRKMERK